MSSTHECCLCGQIRGDPRNDLVARLLPEEPYRRRVMLESRSFAVLPSLGPLAPGHVLLCPRHHVGSFAQVDAALHAEYCEIKATLVARLRAMYEGEITIFEHGMAADRGRMVCTVDHAHLHVVPLPRWLDAAAAISWTTTFDGSLPALRRLAGGQEYVSCETPDGVHRLMTARSGIDSQLMRRIIATSLGHGDRWNWRETPGAQDADATWRRFVQA
jgi:diadenosine tetraphosphate (Ap4A) HIT family hydrolase